MFSYRGKKIQELSDGELRQGLILFTVVFLLMIWASFYVWHPMSWGFWIFRLIAVVAIAQTWRQGLREMRRRKCNR
jgi:urea transporter